MRPLTLILLGACGLSSSKSTPIEPTLNLHEGEETEQVVFVELEGLLVPGIVSLPAPLLSLEFGDTEERVRMLHAEVHEAPKPSADYRLKGRRILGGALFGFERVRYTFILEEGRLTSIDLAMPAAAGQQVFVTAWGPPEDVGVDDEGNPLAHWRGEGLVVRLTEVDGTSLVKFSEPAL